MKTALLPEQIGEVLEIAAVNDGAAAYIKYTDGSGGINQSYFSFAKQIKKRLSVGATASWLFGSLQNSTEYYNAFLGLDIVKNETLFYYGAGLQTGLQYYTLPGKKWQHTIGLTATAYTKLNGQNSSNYLENSVAIKTLDAQDIQFKMPLSLTAGYSIANNNGLSLNLQGTYTKWPVQKLNYKNSFTKDAYSINAGMEYSKRITTADAVIEKYYLAWGVKMEQSYLLLNNTYLNNYAIMMGYGKNISRLLSVNSGIEIGKKGAASLSQIRENYFQFSVGLTLKDIWYGTKKFGRYN